MSVDSINNKLRTALAHAGSFAVCQFPCAAIRNVRETLKTYSSTEASTLSTCTIISIVVGTVTAGTATLAVNILLKTSPAISIISSLSSGFSTGLLSGTVTHHCLKKGKDHAACPDPKSENEEMLPEIAENTTKAVIIDIEQL